MANKRIDDSAGVKIRHYIFGLMRKNNTASIRVASSYELAEMFGTTRRVARYELERLIADGYLIGKHRHGTFTNPHSCYISVTPQQKKMPLIGVIENDGERFCYGTYETRLIAYIELALAKRICYIHHLRFMNLDEESVYREITGLGLDGIVWIIDENAKFPSSQLLERLYKIGIPVVAVGNDKYENVSRVSYEYDDAGLRLFTIFKRENRRIFLVLTMEQRTLARLAAFSGEAGANQETYQVVDGEGFEEKIQNLKNIFSSEYVPDAIFCSNLFAESIIEIMDNFHIDYQKRCRLVALEDFNGMTNFNGYILNKPLYRASKMAVDELMALLINHDSIHHHSLKMSLQSMNIRD